MTKNDTKKELQHVFDIDDELEIAAIGYPEEDQEDHLEWLEKKILDCGGNEVKQEVKLRYESKLLSKMLKKD